MKARASDVDIQTALKAFRHHIEIPLRFMDLDAAGHINNARYASFLEEARLDYARQVLQWNGEIDSINFVVAALNIQFKDPVFLSDCLNLYTRVKSVGGRSMLFEYIGLASQTEGVRRIAFTAETTMVHYHYVQQCSMRIPDQWRVAIKDYEHVGLPE